jgi:hypothetical protein
MTAKRFTVAFLVGGLIWLLAAGSAIAQSPTQDAYGGALGEHVSSGPGGGAGAPSGVDSASTGSLPFTGAQLGIMLLVGVGLVVVGVTMRQASRRQML